MNESKGFLLLIIGILTWTLFLLIRPFLSYVLFSIILAFTGRPLYNHLKKRVGNKTGAFITVFFTILLVLIPLFFVGASIVEEAANVISKLDEPGFIDFDRIEEGIKEFTGLDVDLIEIISRNLTDFFSLSIFRDLAGSLGEFSIGLILMFFIQFFLLKDAKVLVDWIIDSLPFPEAITSELIQKTETSMWALIKGHVLVALVQGTVAGIGLLIVGISEHFFLDFYHDFSRSYTPSWFILGLGASFSLSCFNR